MGAVAGPQASVENKNTADMSTHTLSSYSRSVKHTHTYEMGGITSDNGVMQE